MIFRDINNIAHTLTIQGLTNYELVNLELQSASSNMIFNNIYASELHIKILVEDIRPLYSSSLINKSVTLSDCPNTTFKIITSTPSMGCNDPWEEVEIVAVDPLALLKNQKFTMTGQNTIVDILNNILGSNWYIQRGWGYDGTSTSLTNYIRDTYIDCNLWVDKEGKFTTKWEVLDALIHWINRNVIIDIFNNGRILLMSVNSTNNTFAKYSNDGWTTTTITRPSNTIQLSTVASSNRSISVIDAYHSATIECNYTKVESAASDNPSFVAKYTNDYDSIPPALYNTYETNYRWRDFVNEVRNYYSWDENGNRIYSQVSITDMINNTDRTDLPQMYAQDLNIAVVKNAESKEENFRNYKRMIWVAGGNNKSSRKVYQWDIPLSFVLTTSNIGTNVYKKSVAKLNVSGSFTWSDLPLPGVELSRPRTIKITDKIGNTNQYYIPLKMSVMLKKLDGSNYFVNERDVNVYVTNDTAEFKAGETYQFSATLYNFDGMDSMYSSATVYLYNDNFPSKYTFIQDVDIRVDYAPAEIGDMGSDTGYAWVNESNNEVQGDEFSYSTKLSTYDYKNYGSINILCNPKNFQLTTSPYYFAAYMLNLYDDKNYNGDNKCVSEYRFLNDVIHQYSTATMCENVDLIGKHWFLDKYTDAYFNKKMTPCGYTINFCDNTTNVDLQEMK